VRRFNPAGMDPRRNRDDVPSRVESGRCRGRARAIPIEKWERKGHEFIKLYLAFLVDGAPAVEAVHTAIYKVAQKG
jgi:hypothetical protein